MLLFFCLKELKKSRGIWLKIEGIGKNVTYLIFGEFITWVGNKKKWGGVILNMHLPKMDDFLEAIKKKKCCDTRTPY